MIFRKETEKCRKLIKPVIFGLLLAASLAVPGGMRALAEDSSVTVSSDCTYDPSTALFTFTEPDFGYGEITSNVGDGALTSGPVTLSVPSDYSATLYREGIAYAFEELDEITEAGSYVLHLTGANGSTATPLSFTIIGAYTNLDQASVSGNYSITGVVFEDMGQTVTNNTVDLTAEGSYVIYVSNLSTGEGERIDTTVIHTAPTLKLEALSEKNLARGPVDISDADPSWTLVIYRDDELVEQTDVLKESGRYSITITDRAGNVTSYGFTILIYINNIGWVLIALISVMAAAMLVYLLIKRRTNRVR